MRRPPSRALILAALVTASRALADAPSPRPVVEEHLDPKAWRIIARESGPVNYYALIEDPAMPYLRARYRPPYETAVLGYPLPDVDKQGARKLRWTWRAMTLPRDGDECADGREDSAATLYVTWRRGLRWYSIKYVWSAVGKKGRTCGQKRSPFVAQDTLILESGGPCGVWKNEEIDLKTEFRNHFADGDQSADVPDLLGIAVMSDGDQTQSESAADYAAFTIVR
jgi:hypothetical protein